MVIFHSYVSLPEGIYIYIYIYMDYSPVISWDYILVIYGLYIYIYIYGIIYVDDP